MLRQLCSSTCRIPKTKAKNNAYGVYWPLKFQTILFFSISSSGCKVFAKSFVSSVTWFMLDFISNRKMSDSDSDGEEVLKNIEHFSGPVEDAWKIKIPEFKSNDNPNGLYHSKNLIFIVFKNSIVFFLNIHLKACWKRVRFVLCFQSIARNTCANAGLWCRRLSNLTS